MNNISRFALVVTMIAAASLTACGGDKKKGASQVAAKVNQQEISVHQINFVLQRTPGLKPEQTDQASKRILQGLIDQELAIQQAAEQKLDRDPGVVMAIEAAKRDILARAYADKVASTVSKPSDADLQKYFETHPGLFSQRRIYTLQEFTVEADASQRSTLQPKLQNITDSEQAARIFREAGIKYASRATTQSPENLPLQMVEKLAALNDGQFVVIPTAAGFNMVFVSSTKPAPVTLEKARQAIENYLSNERKRALVADSLKSLRASAKIEYSSQFADSAAAAPKNPAPQAAEPSASGLDASSLQKGLSGLK